MTTATRPSIWLFVAVQAALLVIELATSYDTSVRQHALALTNVAGVVGVLWFDRWLRRRGSQLSLITLLMVIGSVWLDALGNFQHLYAGFWWWDRMTHTVGGMTVSALFIDLFVAEQRRGRWTTGSPPAIWFGFLLGQFVASIYEISEWLGDRWFGTHRVVYTYDTPHDLFFNLVGGLIVVWLLVWRKNRAGPSA